MTNINQLNSKAKTWTNVAIQKAQKHITHIIKFLKKDSPDSVNFRCALVAGIIFKMFLNSTRKEYYIAGAVLAGVRHFNKFPKNLPDLNNWRYKSTLQTVGALALASFLVISPVSCMARGFVGAFAMTRLMDQLFGPKASEPWRKAV